MRLRASGPQPKVADAVHTRNNSAAAPKHRSVYFPELGKFTDTLVLDRYALRQDNIIAGPAVVEERESTLVIGPRATATVATVLRCRCALALPLAETGACAPRA